MFKSPQICKPFKIGQVKLWTIVAYKDVWYAVATEGIFRFQNRICRSNILGDCRSLCPVSSSL